MFWRWNGNWSFMDTEPGKHESQFEALSQRLFGLTAWGNYSGTILERYHYTMLLEEYPDVVESIEAGYVKGLVLRSNRGTPGHLHEVIHFLAHFDSTAANYNDYPIYDEDGFYEFEHELNDEEMFNGWWAEYASKELAEQFEEWEGNTMVPEHGTPEWAKLVSGWFEADDWNSYEVYWEGADSIIVHGWDAESVAKWMLAEYAESMTQAGNPPTLDIHTEN